MALVWSPAPGLAAATGSGPLRRRGRGASASTTARRCRRVIAPRVARRCAPRAHGGRREQQAQQRRSRRPCRPQLDRRHDARLPVSRPFPHRHPERLGQGGVDRQLGAPQTPEPFAADVRTASARCARRRRVAGATTIVRSSRYEPAVGPSRRLPTRPLRIRLSPGEAADRHGRVLVDLAQNHGWWRCVTRFVAVLSGASPTGDGAPGRSGARQASAGSRDPAHRTPRGMHMVRGRSA